MSLIGSESGGVSVGSLVEDIGWEKLGKLKGNNMCLLCEISEINDGVLGRYLRLLAAKGGWVKFSESYQQGFAK